MQVVVIINNGLKMVHAKGKKKSPSGTCFSLCREDTLEFLDIACLGRGMVHNRLGVAKLRKLSR